MRCRFPFLAAAILASSVASIADAPPPPIHHNAPARTLLSDLASAHLAPDTVYLAVSAERQQASASTPPHTKDDTPASIATAYGLITDSFTSVVAIAPRTMVVLNTNLGTPNPYSGMQPTDVLKVLLASLTEAQWKLLTGSTGVGLSDLTTDAQKDEFLALFPAAKMHVQTQISVADPNAQFKDIVVTQDELRRSRLRLGQFIQIGVPVVGKNNSEWLDAPGKFGNVSHQLMPDFGDRQQNSTIYGATVRSEVPNTAKASDLDLDVAPLRKTVPLTGLKTVDDLMAAIAKVSGYELYADRRYGSKSVTLLGVSSARGRDLLSALALCVTGTFRKVGPAYVLTDDVQGAGARKLTIQRFAGLAQMLGHGMVQTAGDKMILDHPIDTLPDLDDRTALNDDQKAEIAKKMVDSPSGTGDLQLPMDKLTPAQRALARSFAAEHAVSPGNMAVTTDGKILMMRQSAMLLLVPSLPDPVSMEYYGSGSRLYQPSSKLQQQMWTERAARARPTPEPEKTPQVTQKAPDFAATLAKYPIRAVYSQVRTVSEIDALIASMKAIGLNMLYLDIFSEGSAHIPASGVPHDNVKAGQDILTEALARASGSGIAVFPVLDLLRWGTDAPGSCRDLTILGETSSQAEAWQTAYEDVVYQDKSIEEARQTPPPSVLSVSPVAPQVQRGLAELVQSVSHMPGVSGFVFRETVTNGYNHAAAGGSYSNKPEVGYTPENRLAFLRQEHIDPIDLESPQGFGNVQADLSLPQLDNEGLGDTGGHWNTFRYTQDIAFLRELFNAARGALPAKPQIWVQQRRQSYGESDWYGLWTDPQSALPELGEDILNDWDPNRDYPALAHAQSPLAIRPLNMWDMQTAFGLTRQIADMKPGWDGFVLVPSGSERGGNPLANLEKTLGVQKP